MLRSIKSLIVSLGLFSLFAVPVLVPATVAAQDIQDSLCSGANFDLTSSSTDCADDAGSTEGLQALVTRIINILSLIIGVIAVIFIIIGGLKYITSGGDSNNVTSAKNTILYAIVGLIIVALAQIIVRFVLNATSDLS